MQRAECRCLQRRHPSHPTDGISGGAYDEGVDRTAERRRPAVKHLPSLLLALCLALLIGSSSALADSSATSDANATPTHYYLSLGDSLAASFQPNGDFEHGYAEQLY